MKMVFTVTSGIALFILVLVSLFFMGVLCPFIFMTLLKKPTEILKIQWSSYWMSKNDGIHLIPSPQISVQLDGGRVFMALDFNWLTRWSAIEVSIWKEEKC